MTKPPPDLQYFKLAPGSVTTVRFLELAWPGIDAFSFDEGIWFARYIDRQAKWRTARNALGRPLMCATKELALSVARMRRSRLTPSFEAPGGYYAP